MDNNSAEMNCLYSFRKPSNTYAESAGERVYIDGGIWGTEFIMFTEFPTHRLTRTSHVCAGDMIMSDKVLFVRACLLHFAHITHSEYEIIIDFPARKIFARVFDLIPDVGLLALPLSFSLFISLFSPLLFNSGLSLWVYGMCMCANQSLTNYRSEL